MPKKAKVNEIFPEEFSQALEQQIVSLENLLEESKQEEVHFQDLLEEIKFQTDEFSKNSDLLTRVENRLETLKFTAEVTEENISKLLGFKEDIDKMHSQVNNVMRFSKDFEERIKRS